MKSLYSTGRDLAVRKTISGLDMLRGADAKPALPTSTAVVKSGTPWWKPNIEINNREGGIAVAGAVLGFAAWKEHRALGALAGLTAARTAPMLWKGTAEDKKEAIAEIAGMGAGTLLSLNASGGVGKVAMYLIGCVGGDVMAKYVMKERS